MKLSSLEIQQALEYSKVRNVNGLCRALNRHWGVDLDYSKTRKFVTEGANGVMACHIAHELGLATPALYVPLYKPNNDKIPPAKKETEFKGISWIENREKWVAQITVLNKKRYLGSFESEIEAALAYNKVAEPLGRKINEVSV